MNINYFINRFNRSTDSNGSQKKVSGLLNYRNANCRLATEVIKSKGIITLVRDAVLDAGHDFHIRRLSDSFATWFVYCDVLGRCAKGVVHWVREIGIICKETARVEVKRLLAVQPSITATFLGVDILSIQQNDNWYKISDGQNSF